MSKKLYQVNLMEEERERLLHDLKQGKKLARTMTKARILLLADEGRIDKEIAETLKVSMATVFRVRQRYCQGGLEAALMDKPRSGAPPKLNSRLEAQLTALACSEPPEGRGRWTLRLLADKLVELELIDSVSHTAVGNWLKKTSLSHG
jgi:transposase